MFEEERNALLRKIAELSEENNKLLHKLVRHNQYRRAWTALRWVVILAMSFGAYYYIQPYLEILRGTYSELFPALQYPFGQTVREN